MFFKANVDLDLWPILEIGPGALPFKFSDIWLDYYFDEDNIIKQSGGSEPVKGKPKVYYRGGRFPFRDNSFKYVIASHVLEHVPIKEIPFFISEMIRVSDAGYIEIPRWTWEMIGDYDVHLSYGDVLDDTLIIYEKKGSFSSSDLLKELLTLNSFQRFVADTKELFFVKYEWNGDIKYKIIQDDDFDYSFNQTIDRLKRDLSNNLFNNHSPHNKFKLSKYLLKIYHHYKFITRKKASVEDIKKFLSYDVIDMDILKQNMKISREHHYIRSGNNYFPVEKK